MEKALVIVLLCGAGYLAYKAMSVKKSALYDTKTKPSVSASNLDELSQKFKHDYINQKLSEFASRENIDDGKILAVFPGFARDLNAVSIKWAEYKGNSAELQTRLANYNGGGSTIQYRFEQVLKDECKAKIDEIIGKIGGLK